MSRIGKKPIQILSGVEIKIDNQKIEVKGPKGSLSFVVPEEIATKSEGGQLIISQARETKNSKALWGLWRALLQNAVVGVSTGFEKKLEIIGVGYKVAIEGGKTLNFSLGFSHPVKLELPEGLIATAEKNILTIAGIDKQSVGQVAAKIRSLKKPEPYKGKGIRYLGEKVRRKEGKKAGGK